MADDTGARIARHRTVAADLDRLDDRQVTALLDTAAPLGVGIGGHTARLDVGGVPVFVKRIPLTDRECGPGQTTANLFGLPTSYQYGVGSTGFGAWRELATHRKTTDWVRRGVAGSFPLLHHWRVLPTRPAPAPHDDWDGDPAVAARLAAIGGATAAIVLFLEHLPLTLHEWLLQRFDAGDGEQAVARADRELHAITEVLRAHGMVHFDAHPGNVLTDGHRLYLGDFGLTLDPDFALSAAEVAFLGRHRDWDRWDTERYLVNWLCHRLAPDTDRATVIRSGGAGLPGYAAALLTRYAPTVLLLNDFYTALCASKSSPFPAEALRRADRTRPFHP